MGPNVKNFLNNLPHMIVALGVIGATAGMAASGVISGAEALPVIIGVGGFSMGVGGSSTSVSTVADALPAVSSSSGGQTTTISPAVHTAPPAPTSSTPAT